MVAPAFVLAAATLLFALAAAVITGTARLCLQHPRGPTLLGVGGGLAFAVVGLLFTVESDATSCRRPRSSPPLFRARPPGRTADARRSRR